MCFVLRSFVCVHVWSKQVGTRASCMSVYMCVNGVVSVFLSICLCVFVFVLVFVCLCLCVCVLVFV